jgi:HD superfamily phosphohydrolase
MNDKKSICKNIKHINDSIHNIIPISLFAQLIIDTNYFQRLRKLKQLGTCCYVFPNAIHTRFEHSLGTYFLAGELLNCIKTNSEKTKYFKYMTEIEELKDYYMETYGLENLNKNNFDPLDEYTIELCKISSLTHDISHGAFSHVFDDVFLKAVNMDNQLNSTHEKRGEIILELLIKNNDILKNIVSDNEIQFMKNLINPKNEHQGFIYQIVSNNLNSIDVDKMDYITRDNMVLFNKSNMDCNMLIKQVKIIDNNIVYPEQAFTQIKNLFQIRYELHYIVYNHKAVISAQILIVEIMVIMDPILKLSESINNMEQFCNLTDEYLSESIKILNNFIVLSEEFTVGLSEDFKKRIKQASILVDRLNNHKLYPHLGTKISKNRIDFTNFNTKHSDRLIIYQTKIGFVSGNKTNPLDNIYVYKTKNSNEMKAIKLNKYDMTLLLPNFYQEHITMFFLKDEYDLKTHKNLKNNLEYYKNIVEEEFNKINDN